MKTASIMTVRAAVAATLPEGGDSLMDPQITEIKKMRMKSCWLGVID